MVFLSAMHAGVSGVKSVCLVPFLAYSVMLGGALYSCQLSHT